MVQGELRSQSGDHRAYKNRCPIRGDRLFRAHLYRWGENELARTCVKWLLSIQLDSGAFPASDGVAYTFDTAQVLRGLLVATNDVPGAEAAARRAADWLLTQIDTNGRVRHHQRHCG